MTDSASTEQESSHDNNDIQILSEDYSTFDYNFKIIIIGDQSVGKSALTNKALKEDFDINYKATVGFEFYLMNLKFKNNIIRLQIWDTCGQEIYRSLISNFYRGASIAVLVYAINDRQSFSSLDEWIKQIKENGSPDVKFFLIGNKKDLEKERVVSFEEGKTLSENYDMSYFNETSAKTGENARKLMIDAAKMLYDDAKDLEKAGKQNDTLSSNYVYNNIINRSKLDPQKCVNKKKNKGKNRCCN